MLNIRPLNANISGTTRLNLIELSADPCLIAILSCLYLLAVFPLFPHCLTICLHCPHCVTICIHCSPLCYYMHTLFPIVLLYAYSSSSVTIYLHSFPLCYYMPTLFPIVLLHAYTVPIVLLYAYTVPRLLRYAYTVPH